MIILQLQDVARHFGADVLFSHVQMDIQDKSRIALVGRNGAGKSTLLKIIAGETRPDEGEVIKRKDLTIGYLEQNTGLHSQKTIYQEMLEPFSSLIQKERELRRLESEMAEVSGEELARLMQQYDQLQHQFQEENGYAYESEIRSVLHGFQFYESDFDTPISDLSGGQKTRLALAKMLLTCPDLLILDEPTNHLDIETLRWLENYLQGYAGALLIVSHDRYFLDKVVNEVYELEFGQCKHYVGNYTQYTIEKETQLLFQQKQYEKQQQEIKKMETFIQKNMARASTTKRAQSRQKQLEKMDRIVAPTANTESVRLHFPIDQPSGNVVLQTEDLAIGYETPLAENIQMDIRKQEAIAIVGPNGIGKSTLLKTIMKQIPPLAGTIHFGTNVEIGYYDQEQASLHPKKTVLQELWDEHPLTNEKDIRTVLASVLFKGEDIKKTVAQLSGGEKARLLLAKLAMQKENFLILDEPTNHLDLDSKEVLEDALIHYEGTLLFVSHDRYFINRIATKIIELTPEGSILYHGDYDYYEEKKAEEEEKKSLLKEEEQKEEIISSTKAQYLSSKEEQKERRKLQRAVDALEEKMEELEQKITQIQEEMCLPEYQNDSYALNQMHETVAQLEEEYEQSAEEWEEKALLLEE